MVGCLQARFHCTGDQNIVFFSSSTSQMQFDLASKNKLQLTNLGSWINYIVLECTGMQWPLTAAVVSNMSVLVESVTTNLSVLSCSVINCHSPLSGPTVMSTTSVCKCRTLLRTLQAADRCGALAVSRWGVSLPLHVQSGRLKMMSGDRWVAGLHLHSYRLPSDARSFLIDR